MCRIPHYLDGLSCFNKRLLKIRVSHRMPCTSKHPLGWTFEQAVRLKVHIRMSVMQHVMGAETPTM